MWVPKEVADWFRISKDSVDALREELAVLKAEHNILNRELTSTKITNDWLRLQFNQLQLENKALLERAYNIRVPVPEIVRRSEPNLFNLQDLFSDQRETESGWDDGAEK